MRFGLFFSCRSAHAAANPPDHRGIITGAIAANGTKSSPITHERNAPIISSRSGNAAARNKQLCSMLSNREKDWIRFQDSLPLRHFRKAKKLRTRLGVLIRNSLFCCVPSCL